MSLLSSKEDCAIFSLPDELLSHILSFVTDIGFKLNLESVCKRFQQISTTNTSSWNGNYRLDILVACRRSLIVSGALIKYDNNCAGRTNYLNSVQIPLHQWPTAIHQLLQRSIIRNLSLHINAPPNDVSSITHVLSALASIQNHPTHLLLNSIEFHRQCQKGTHVADDLFLWAIHNSSKTVQHILLALDSFKPTSAELWERICTTVDVCSKLQSFSVCLPVGLEMTLLNQALQNKPLRELVICHRFLSTTAASDFILPICSSIKTLKLDLTAQLTDAVLGFLDSIEAGMQESLTELVLACNISSRFLPYLDNLPQVLPNLKLLQLEAYLPLDDELHEETRLFNTQFFDACTNSPEVDRRVVIAIVVVNSKAAFKASVVNFGAEMGVDVVFGDGDDESWVRLSRGSGSIELHQVEDFPDCMLTDDSASSCPSGHDDDSCNSYDDNVYAV